jgi:hypothetical protein
MRYTPGALAVVGSNPTGPTDYMGCNIACMYIQSEEKGESIAK